MSSEKVWMLGVAGAIVIAVLLISGSPEAVQVVIGALVVLLAALRGNNEPSTDETKTRAGQDQEGLDLEASE